MKTMIGYVVVDDQELSNALGVQRTKNEDFPIGTNFIAVFYSRRFAKELAQKWGATAEVVKVRMEVLS